jgi:sugar-specific transcriptional regulator TrmB
VAAALAKITKIHRATTYSELESLIEKGMASYIVKEYKRHYRAAAPEKLHEMLASKQSLIDSILPALTTIHHKVEKSTVEIFEGKEGVKTYFKDILTSGEKEFLAFGVTGYSFEVMKMYFPHFLRDYIKSGMKTRMIANPIAKKRLEGMPKGTFRVKYLPEEFASQTVTHIYADKLAFLSLRDGNIYVTIIKDRILNQAYRKYFELMWRCVDNPHILKNGSSNRRNK